MSHIRILLADDHALIRSGIRSLLEAVPDFQVVGEAGNGREALDLALRLQPQICLMDITMPELNGLLAADRIRKEAPGCRVVILSMHADEEFVRHARESGAQGYLRKDADPAHLEGCIRRVLGGEACFPAAEFAGRSGITQVPRCEGPVKTPLDALTSRQREVLQLIAEGRNTKEIALRMQVSVKTIETHRSQLMDRLAIHDVAGLVRFAMRTGLVARPD